MSRAELKKKDSMQELDELYNGLRFTFKKSFQVKDIRKCRDILQDMILHFPDKSDARHKKAAKKLEEYDRYMQMQTK
jgi:hypothetical protein